MCCLAPDGVGLRKPAPKLTSLCSRPEAGEQRQSHDAAMPRELERAPALSQSFGLGVELYRKTDLKNLPGWQSQKERVDWVPLFEGRRQENKKERNPMDQP